MIIPSSSSSGTPPPATAAGRTRAGSDAGAPAVEALSTGHAAALQAELARQPEIRPEVVERASRLLADGNYPPRVIIEDLARLIAQSRDLSESEDSA